MQVWPIGVEACDARSIALTDPGYMIWCPKYWDLISTPDVPTAEEKAKRSISYAGDSVKGDIDYWSRSVAGVMLHEMHHAFLKPSSDVRLNPALPFFQPGLGPDNRPLFSAAYCCV